MITAKKIPGIDIIPVSDRNLFVEVIIPSAPLIIKNYI
jgi:hypothetical protein